MTEYKCGDCKTLLKKDNNKYYCLDDFICGEMICPKCGKRPSSILVRA